MGTSNKADETEDGRVKDYTVAVEELRSHYNALRVLKKSIREQVKAEYEAKIDFEIRSRVEAAELKFANHLAVVKERDNVPVTVLQDHVLRTRTWSRWEHFRDLAGMPGEFVRAEDAREAKRLANSPFRWSDDYSTLTVVKDSTGADIEPLVMRIEGLSSSHGSWYVPDGVAEDALVIARRDSGFMMMISDELKKALDNEWISQ